MSATTVAGSLAARARPDGVTGGPMLASPPPRLARSEDGYPEVTVNDFLLTGGGRVSIDCVPGRPA